jgi:DNA-binding TFAR19-related protein (PDSD5 family)
MDTKELRRLAGIDPKYTDLALDEALTKRGREPLNRVQSLLPDMDNAVHTAIREIAAMNSGAEKKMARDTLIDMLELEIKDYRKAIANLKRIK